MKRLISLAILIVAAATPVHAREEHVGRNAELGDPARWYEPADTPRKQYETAMKEAVAAKAEALRECRGSAERKVCEAEARRRFDDDVQRARAHLATPAKG